MRNALLLLCFLWLAVVAGCQKADPRGSVPRPRVIAYSPVLTTMLFDMGLGDHVVGVSEYALPPEGRRLPVVGGAEDVRAEAIVALQADVILVQTDPRRFETVLRLQPNLKIEYFRIATLEEVAAAMERIGRILNQPEKGRRQAEVFRRRLEAVRQATAEFRPLRRTLFVMDYQRPFAAGGGTFLDEMIQLAGGENVLAGVRDWHSPSVEAVLAARPEVILCQCKPAQAADARRYWHDLFARAGLSVRVAVVTEDTWTIPAGHLAGHAETLAGILHPERVSAGR